MITTQRYGFVPDIFVDIFFSLPVWYTMPTKTQKQRWKTDCDADKLLRALLSGEELLHGQPVTGQEAPSEIYNSFEEFKQFDAAIFRAHWGKMKKDMGIAGNQKGKFIFLFYF